MQQPADYVDITSVFEQKCDLLCLHAGRMRNMEASGGPDLVKYSRLWTYFVGCNTG
ncbi:MAG TPA: hypothetical protein VKY59_16035 [Spirillospora sp.]|nr:hypothetical protein [Spirillospora sp.]